MFDSLLQWFVDGTSVQAGNFLLLNALTVGAAEGCDLLILICKNKIKRSQPAAAPTGRCQVAMIHCGSGLAREGVVSVDISVA
jgi:hypothetical protein